MAELQLFNTDIWREITEISQGVKKLVKGEADEQKLAYFKTLSRREGPSGANEYIVYRLAKFLNLPVANIQLIKFNQNDGMLSLEIVNANPWQVFPDKNQARQYLEDESIISKIIVFDLWVRNKDRHDRNLVFQQCSKEKYQIYMIYNEHCLFGFQQAPPAPLDDYEDIIRIPELVKNVTEAELINTVSEIQKIPDNQIADLIDNFRQSAPAYLNEAQAIVIKTLLLSRKAQLEIKVKEWYIKNKQ